MEAWGILRGLTIAWEKGIKQVEVECNSLIVIHWMRSENYEDKVIVPIKNIITKCEMMKTNWRVKLFHAYREQNLVANTLARKALDIDKGDCVFNRPPSFF